MTRWFRFYNEVLHDPKVQKLPGDDFKAWVNLLCLASSNDGDLPSISDMAFALRMTEERVRGLLDGFVRIELVDEIEGGFRPHNWNSRQYKSDVSSDRVKRYRKRQSNGECNVTVTSPDTEQKQNRTEQTQSVRANDPWVKFRIEVVQISIKHNNLNAHNTVDLVEKWKAQAFPLDICRAILLPGIQKKPDKGLHYWEPAIIDAMKNKNPAPVKIETQDEREARWRSNLDMLASKRPWPFRYASEIPADFAERYMSGRQKPAAEARAADFPDLPQNLDRRAQG